MASDTWRLFRYRDISQPHVISEIWNSELFCGLPSKLNDPFDCQVHWRESFERVLCDKDLSSERRFVLQDILQQFSDRAPPTNVGVCCFTIKADDHLMWAHYAQNYHGACLLYEFPVDYLWNQYSPEHSDFFFVGGSQVHYSDDAYSDWLKNGNLFEPTSDPAENALTHIFTSKSAAWAHEEEFRLVMNQPGFLKLQSHHLKQISFGLRTPEKTRALISEIARAKNPNVVLGDLTRSIRKDFGLNFPGHDL